MTVLVCDYCEEELTQDQRPSVYGTHDMSWMFDVKGSMSQKAYHLWCHFKFKDRMKLHSTHSHYCHLSDCDKFPKPTKPTKSEPLVDVMRKRRESR